MYEFLAKEGVLNGFLIEKSPWVITNVNSAARSARNSQKQLPKGLFFIAYAELICILY